MTQKYKDKCKNKWHRDDQSLRYILGDIKVFDNNKKTSNSWK